VAPIDYPSQAAADAADAADHAAEGTRLATLNDIPWQPTTPPALRVPKEPASPPWMAPVHRASNQAI
jgi:hypothetical protein